MNLTPQMVMPQIVMSLGRAVSLLRSERPARGGST